MSQPYDLLDPLGHVSGVLLHPSQPGVAHQGGQVRSLSRVLPKADVHKVSHLGTEDPAREARGRLIDDVFKELEYRHGFVRAVGGVWSPGRPGRGKHILRILQEGRPETLGQVSRVWRRYGVCSEGHL